MCQMSHVMCHVSCVMCHVSHVTCHVSHVTCPKKIGNIFVIKKINKQINKKNRSQNKIWQSGGASQWRVCYQRGIPRLVLIMIKIFFLNIFFSTQFQQKKSHTNTSVSFFICCIYIYTFYWFDSKIILKNAFVTPKKRWNTLPGLFVAPHFILPQLP